MAKRVEPSISPRSPQGTSNKWSHTNSRISPKSTSTSLLAKMEITYFEKHFTSGFNLGTIAFYLDQGRHDLCYSLSDLYSDFRICPVTKAEEEAGQILLAKMLKNVEVRVTKSAEIEIFKVINIPGLSSRVKPDISILSEKGDYVAFIEVESETLQLTVRKMYFVLLLQLIYLRITNCNVFAVTGFVLPKFNNRKGCVAVTVTWNVSAFRFVGTLDPIRRPDLQEFMLKVITEQVTLTLGCLHPAKVPQRRFYFQDSLNPNEIKKYMDLGGHSIRNVKFFHSKFSIIFSDKHEMVYKCPLIDNDLSILLSLRASGLKQVLLPVGRVRRFFSFPLLHPPLDLKSIRQCFAAFAISTLHALEELHDIGYAHLDVRFPNVCFKRNQYGWQAVLIDLDSAVEVTLSPAPPINQKSLMYNVMFNEHSQYDWRQFALLLFRVIEGDDDQYHTRLPVFQESREEKELRKSFEFGTKPPSWALHISLVESPISLDNLLPL